MTTRIVAKAETSTVLKALVSNITVDHAKTVSARVRLGKRES